MGSGALGKNIEDQRGAVQNLNLASLLNVSLLDRRKGSADENDIRFELFYSVEQLFNFAAANKIPGIRFIAGRGNDGSDFCTGRTCQFTELIQCLRAGARKNRMQNYCAVAALGAFDQMNNPTTTGRSVLVFVEDPNVAGWNNRRDSMLVNHLTDGILKQYDKLIERLDLSLKFDSIHEID